MVFRNSDACAISPRRHIANQLTRFAALCMIFGEPAFAQAPRTLGTLTVGESSFFVTLTAEAEAITVSITGVNAIDSSVARRTLEETEVWILLPNSQSGKQLYRMPITGTRTASDRRRDAIPVQWHLVNRFERSPEPGAVVVRVSDEFRVYSLVPSL